LSRANVENAELRLVLVLPQRSALKSIGAVFDRNTTNPTMALPQFVRCRRNSCILGASLNEQPCLELERIVDSCDRCHLESLLGNKLSIAECVGDEEKSGYRTRRSGTSRTLAEEQLQRATASVEITQDSDQKAERVKEGRQEVCANEVECVRFRLMARTIIRTRGHAKEDTPD
jgi:hypothetical protein